MKTVSDASVLIFLGKVRRLDVLEPLFPGSFHLSELVRREVLTEALPTAESEYLNRRLASWKVSAPRLPRKTGKILSLADWSVLELAKEVRADRVLADDKALRNALIGQRFHVIGTLGILWRAAQAKIISRENARTSAENLITSHRYHVGAETYHAFLKSLSGL